MPPNYWNVLTECPVHCKCNIQHSARRTGLMRCQSSCYTPALFQFIRKHIWQGILNTFKARAKHLENCWLWAVWHTCFIACDSVDGVNPDLQLDPVLMFFICVFDFYKLVIQVRGEGTILSLIGTSERDCPFADRFSRHEDIFQLCHLQ